MLKLMIMSEALLVKGTLLKVDDEVTPELHENSPKWHLAVAEVRFCWPQKSGP